MESLLALLGLLFFMFLVLAAAVEVVLEVFRGTLERFGFTWAKGKVSLEDALKLADEFVPDKADLNTTLNTKLEAIKFAAEQLKGKAANKSQTFDSIKTNLKAATAGSKELGEIAGELNAVAAAVKSELQKSERLRVWVLRFIAAILGIFLAYTANFYVFRILAEAPEAGDLLANLPGLQRVWVNVLVGGLAAAAGSSYWHDKLDRVRNLKSALQDVKKLTA